MLEKYSKTKSYMFIRKRKAAKKKRKAQEESGSAPLPEEYGDDEEAGLMDGDDDTPSYAEHAFTFESFEKVCPDALQTHRAEFSDLHRRWSYTPLCRIWPVSKNLTSPNR